MVSTGPGNITSTWLGECCKQVGAVVKCNSRNKLHQTTYKYFFWTQCVFTVPFGPAFANINESHSGTSGLRSPPRRRKTRPSLWQWLTPPSRGSWKKGTKEERPAWRWRRRSLSDDDGAGFGVWSVVNVPKLFLRLGRLWSSTLVLVFQKLSHKCSWTSCDSLLGQLCSSSALLKVMYVEMISAT